MILNAAVMDNSTNSTSLIHVRHEPPRHLEGTPPPDDGQPLYLLVRPQPHRTFATAFDPPVMSVDPRRTVISRRTPPLVGSLPATTEGPFPAGIENGYNASNEKGNIKIISSVGGEEKFQQVFRAENGNANQGQGAVRARTRLDPTSWNKPVREVVRKPIDALLKVAEASLSFEEPSLPNFTNESRVLGRSGGSENNSVAVQGTGLPSRYGGERMTLNYRTNQDREVKNNKEQKENHINNVDDSTKFEAKYIEFYESNKSSSVEDVNSVSEDEYYTSEGNASSGNLYSGKTKVYNEDDEEIDVGEEADLVFHIDTDEEDNIFHESENFGDEESNFPCDDDGEGDILAIDEHSSSTGSLSKGERDSLENGETGRSEGKGSTGFDVRHLQKPDEGLASESSSADFGGGCERRFEVDAGGVDSGVDLLFQEEVDGTTDNGGFSLEDEVMRNKVLVLLWVLLGERRLMEVGFPQDPVHRILWLTVDVCCSVAGVKSAAAVPLTPDHDCGDDMLCFRDHTHRFLEVCAPTRDLWKQFGWASLTVDAVIDKIYKQDPLLWPQGLTRYSRVGLDCRRRGDRELKPLLANCPEEQTPPRIREALMKLGRLEKQLVQKTEGDARLSQENARHTVPLVTRRPHLVPRQTGLAAQSGTNQNHVVVKKKRGRPAKIVTKSDAGRIERVMLWKFLLNLLEDPRNAPCIHWVQREEGIFRILNTDWLARLWGRRHGNPRMTYEKMARAMRTYYRSKVLQPVPRTRNLPRKLVYKFNPEVVKKVTAMKHSAISFSGRGLNYNVPTTTTS
uniref:ETS domain-containing protein n=1 Tax=Timema bartmani TaxID=61472 RepID=A0A7R9HY12_9NEOP|nr:unnamed protein product [Timema bartmani]